ncbi:unnamed protein product [Paramecium sonneborni]|uniref:Uncharacterized protein n=1 Tax=Paramecium sonneborni TaxID=65129 RepID=A0A8S1QL01_9CILI|nr:unnamed protein product [Paramecium sonneborni]
MQNSSIFNGKYVVQKRYLLDYLELCYQAMTRLLMQQSKLLWHGEQHEYNVIILQFLRKDLSYFMKSQKKFSFKSTIQLEIQIMYVLERMHNKARKYFIQD